LVLASGQTGESVASDFELAAGLNAAGRWVHMVVTNRGDIVEGVLYDVTERRRAELAARERAETDPLTGLRSRAGAEVAIGRMLLQALAAGSGVGLLFLDLDGFKAVNDQHGHAAGDQVLIECARRLRALVHDADDIVARLGGDEFVLALPLRSRREHELSALAEALLQSVGHPIDIGGGATVQLGASIGVAIAPLHGRDRDVLTRAADKAMYAVKRNGKAGWAVAGEPPHGGASASQAGSSVQSQASVGV
jgi:diguanylate cyclase (GGDEF)-like protein